MDRSSRLFFSAHPGKASCSSVGAVPAPLSPAVQGLSPIQDQSGGGAGSRSAPPKRNAHFPDELFFVPTS